MKIPQYSTADIAPLTHRHRVARWITLCCLFALLALFGISNIIEPHGSLFRALVQSVPLLLFVPGVWIAHHRTYSWLCFVILFYFTAFVVEAMSPFANFSDYLATALTVVLFPAAMMASRWRQHSRLAAHQNPEPSANNSCDQ
ncbi:DUF2069 domain-containing protein [Gilvimarinus polysaccharolyticus]|uniref:DUF2069 domain-containing protein n=1 Tax=Gilvimarinus polysaccharolyticus TaxID=863921 RepID=UPI00067395B9|nr:DUF2069 domain-containing protein [Gilvimarinus polysaccharolyticus]